MPPFTRSVLVVAGLLLLAGCDDKASEEKQQAAVEHKEVAAQHMDQILKTDDPQKKAELLEQAQEELKKSNDLRREAIEGDKAAEGAKPTEATKP